MIKLGVMNQQLKRFRGDKTIKMIFDIEKAIIYCISEYEGLKLSDLLKQLVLEQQIPILTALMNYSNRPDANKLIVLRLLLLLILVFSQTKQESIVNDIINSVQRGDINLEGY